MEDIESILQKFIENLRYEVFQKDLDSVGVIDKIEINNRVSFQRENSTNERECGLEDWYTILQTAHRLCRDERLVKLLVGDLTEFGRHAKSWLADNCDGNIREFLRALTENPNAVIRYIGGDNSKEVERTVRGVIERIRDCVRYGYQYKNSINNFLSKNGNRKDNTQNDIKAFLCDVLNSIFAWIRSRYSIVITYNILSNEVFLLYFILCLLCGCGGNESLILGKLHRLIEGVRRGMIKQHEFCERVGEIVDMMPYSKYFKEQYLEARLCNEGVGRGNRGAPNTLCQDCNNIFYIANNCEACYRCCASTLRRNSDDNIEIYRAEINGEIYRIYPYEEDYKRWEFTGKVWFYLRNDGTNRGINDRILMGIMQIIYYSPDRGSFGSILLEFEPDRNSQNGNSVSGIFRGRYIKLMRHEGNVWHVRVNTFPVEWLPQNRLCEYLERNSLLRQLVNC